MSNPTLTFQPDTNIQTVYGRAYGEYLSEVDCRLLFLGERLRPLRRAYERAVQLFSSLEEPRALVEALRQAHDIREFYGSMTFTCWVKR